MSEPFYFDKRNPQQLSLEPQSELEQILQRIRSTTDRIASEDWSSYYERTMALAHAEYARQRQRRLQALRQTPHPNPAKGGVLKEQV